MGHRPVPKQLPGRYTGGRKPVARTTLSAAAVLVLLALTGISYRSSQAQEPSRAVRGTVVEFGTGRPVDGAEVIAQGTRHGTITDAQGHFLLPGLVDERVTLQVVKLGYRAHAEVVRAGGAEVRLEVTPAAVELDELVVTGTPGAERMRALGNAVGRIKVADVLQVGDPPTMHALLDAQVPGVQVAFAAGEVGGGANIRIRGASSISLSSEPLLYIDGVRVNGLFADQGGGVGAVGIDPWAAPSRINDLDPKDIESIEIIKGPAAATLYGTEASNGVIQVITKRGRAGKPTFNLSVTQGAVWLPNPEKLFAPSYYKDAQGRIVEFNVLQHDRTVGFPVSRYGYCPAPYAQTGSSCTGSPFSTGTPRSYAGNVSGGSDGVKYYFSFDYDHDAGPVDYNWQNRINGRGNISWTPSAKLSVDFGVGGVRGNLRSARPQAPITMAIMLACKAGRCLPGSGPLAMDSTWRGYTAYVPELYEDNVQGWQDVDRTTYTATATHRPVSWFSQRLSVGGDFTNTRNSCLYKQVTGLQALASFAADGWKEEETNSSSYASLDYATTLSLPATKNLGTRTSVGVQYYRKQNTWVHAWAWKFPAPELETITAGAVKGNSEDALDNKSLGTFVQEQLAWKDRLFFTAALRGDDNSAFGTSYRFVAYPRLSASWVVSDEPFMAHQSLFSTLRLRAAWGRAGRQPDVLAAVRTYAPQVAADSVPALTPENVGNPDLRPEVSDEVEAGVTASVLHDRLAIELTGYDKNTTDAILRLPALPSMGFPGTRFQNVGKIRNRGLEVGLRGRPLARRQLTLDLDLAFAAMRNEVLDLGGLPPYGLIGSSQYALPGYPIGAIFEKRVVAADIVPDNTGRNVATNVMCESGPLEPRSTTLSRGGGPPVPCAAAPRVYRGPPLPTWTGSLGATLTVLQRLKLHALVEGVGGYRRLDNYLSARNRTAYANTRAILERTDPILLGYEAIRDLEPTGLVDGGFARLRRLSASYTLSPDWAGRFSASRVDLTLALENPALLWQAQRESFGTRVVDPEVRATGSWDNAAPGLGMGYQEAWPQVRRFSAVLRVTW